MAYNKALQQLNRGLAAVRLAPLPSIMPGIPWCPGDCSFQRALRPADPACQVGSDTISFSDRHVAQRLAAAWGDDNGDSRFYVTEGSKLPYQVRMPRAMRNFVRSFDRFAIVDTIAFEDVNEAAIEKWVDSLDDGPRLDALMAAWAAEQEQREPISV